MRRLSAVAMVLLIAFAGRAAELPVIPNIVPEQTAICVVVRDLSGLLKEKSTQDAMSKLTDTPAFRSLFGTQDLKKIAEAARFLVGQTGLTPEQWIDDLFGDLALVSYQPGPPGKPDQESGLFVLKPRKAETLRKLIDQLDAIQTASGEIRKVRQAEQEGIAYTVRETAKGPSEAYAFRDGSFLFSTREATLKSVLAKDRPTIDLNEQLARLGMADERLTVLFQPRAFDADLAAADRGGTTDSDRAFVAQFRKIWASLSCLGVSFSFGPTVEFRAAVQWTTPAAMSAAGVQSMGSQVPRIAFPPNALLAVGGKIEARPAMAFLRDFLSTEGRKELDGIVNDLIGPAVGKDQLPIVLDKLGPNWIAALEPPDKESELLPRWTLAVQLGATPQMNDALKAPMLQGAEFLAQQFRFAHNKANVDQIRVTRTETSGTSITTLENELGFADGWKPSFAAYRGHLVFASSPEQLLRFDHNPGTPPLAALRGKLWTEYLKPRQAPLAKFLAKLNGKDEKSQVEELARLSKLIELFDNMRLEWKSTADTATLSLRAKLNLPNNK